MDFEEKRKEERKQPNEFEMLQARTEFPNHWQKRKQIENRFAAVSVPSPLPFSSHLKVQFNSRHNNFKWKIIIQNVDKIARGCSPRKGLAKTTQKEKSKFSRCRTIISISVPLCTFTGF